MKKVIILINILFMVCSCLTAQQKFIKTSNISDFGNAIKIFATSDGGCIVFSLDSLKLSKFNPCGYSEWSKKINVPNATVGLNDVIQCSNGEMVLLTRMPDGNNYASLITRIDQKGNIIWSKSYEDGLYTHFPYTISEDNQANLFLFSNVENINDNSVYNLISKIDGNGNLLWTKFYNHGGVWGGAIVTTDNGLLIRTGNNFIKTDNAGNVQWHSQIVGSGYNYFAPVEVSDGYIFTGYTNGSQYVTFGKIDKTGNLLWGGRKTSDISGSPPKLRKRNNGNIVGVFLKNGSTIIEFDKDLNVLNIKSINPGIVIYGRDICFLNSGFPVMAGITGGSPSLLVSKMDNNYNTDCNAAADPVNFIIDPITQSFQLTNVFTYNLNVINRTYSTDTFSLTMNSLCFQPRSLDLGNDTLICGNTSITLQNISGDTFESYLWSTGDTTPAVNVTQAGQYWMQASYNCGENKVADSTTISVVPVVSADLGDDLFICEDSTATLIAPACTNCNYLWSTGSTITKIEISKAGTYWLSIDNSNGCITGDTIEASIVKCQCNFYVPNAFTPNDDTNNEIFKPVYDCDFNDYRMQIFNRWGELVYETRKMDEGWNGRFKNTIAPQGIYVYSVSYRPILKGETSKLITKTGTVAVIY